MDFSFSPEQEEFREQVRNFIKEKPPAAYPCQIEDEGYGFGGFSREYSREVGRNKWIGISWPEEYDGLGKPLIYNFILKDELALHDAPTFATNFTEPVGFAMIRYGTEQQKRDFLPKMSRGELVWATALSEPDAGSDLFGMKTTAVRKGDYYVVNGNKVWNTMAHLADYLMLLAITDTGAGRGKGMTTFIVDPKTPGISIKPIVDRSYSESFAEVFFDEVSIPIENVFGQVNQGLPITLELLEGDRFWCRMVRASSTKRMLNLVVQYCKETRYGKSSLFDDPWIRGALAEVAGEAEACHGLAYYVISLMDKGVNVGLTATYEESILKVFADELGRHVANIWMQILGPRGQLMQDSKYCLFDGTVAHRFLFAPGVILAGGTTQMQRQTIATRGLGLPRA